ncbi:MAG: type II secretion system protein GspD, partial [Phycisphaerae bacterium]
IKIATQHTLDKQVYTATYDINDLLFEIPMFSNPPATDLNRTRQTLASAAPNTDSPQWRSDYEDEDEPTPDPGRRRRVNELIDLIQDTIAPDSWIGRNGSIGVIREFNGQLVITQNSAIQGQVADLLGQLRAQRAVQIAIEARFITVTSNYLEELGIDLDIVLNNGNAGFDFVSGASGALTDPVLGSQLVLPRSLGRLGVTPNAPGLGTALPTDTAFALAQPFTDVSLVPRSRGGAGGRLTPVPVTTQVTAFANAQSLGSDIAGSFAGNSIGPAFSLFGSFLDNIQVDFLIRATQADSRSTVLTSPQLVLSNGQRAFVVVSIQQGYVSQLQPVVATGAAATAPTTSVVSSGAVLDVEATVTADKRYVTMTVRPSVTRLLALQTIPFGGTTAGGGFGGGAAATAAFIQLPTLSTQQVQTTVTIPDGGTLLIGGQKLGSETEVDAGVPILSKIPVLKRLYSARTMVKDEQTLLMLVKPRILIQAEQEELAFPSFGAG